jgi:hypothetical protein
MKPTRHGDITTTKKDIFFYSFKGDEAVSTLDQVTLPPAMGMQSFAHMGKGLFHNLGEWLKREGHDWETLEEEKLCRLAIDWFNILEGPTSAERRRFDRLAQENKK